MNKSVAFTLFMLMCILSAKSEPTVIANYYNLMQSLQAGNDEEAYNVREKLKKCFFSNPEAEKNGFSGVNVMDNYVSNDVIPSSTFIRRMAVAIHDDKRLRILSFNVGEPVKCAFPNMDKKNDIIYQTKVNVLFSINGTKKNVTDFISTSGNLITTITKESRVFDSYQAAIEAGILYNLKKYKEAYDIFLDLKKRNPEDANAIYRLAIMTAKGQGTKKNIPEAISLLKSILYLSPRDNNSWASLWNLKEKARTALYLLTVPNPV